MKRIFALVALFVVVAGVSTVSAFDLGDLFTGGESEQVTIGGIDFSIPDGYKEVESDFMNQTSADFSIPGYDVEGKAYKKGSTEVVIVVGNYSNSGFGGNFSDLGNETTISGIEGYADETDGTYVFSYEDNKCLVTFSTNDKNVIDEFIMA